VVCLSVFVVVFVFWFFAYVVRPVLEGNIAGGAVAIAVAAAAVAVAAAAVAVAAAASGTFAVAVAVAAAAAVEVVVDGHPLAGIRGIRVRVKKAITARFEIKNGRFALVVIIIVIVIVIDDNGFGLPLLLFLFRFAAFGWHCV